MASHLALLTAGNRAIALLSSGRQRTASGPRAVARRRPKAPRPLLRRRRVGWFATAVDGDAIRKAKRASVDPSTIAWRRHGQSHTRSRIPSCGR